MKILYGTTNQGKLQAMKKSVEGMDMEVISLRDLDCDLPVIVENGKTPLENAEIKARAYFEAFHMPGFPLDCLSVDIATGKYYYDLDVKDVSTSVDDGVRKFFGEIFDKGE